MKVHRYSRWDGSQQEFSLDVESALDALSEMMMHGMSARDALDSMREYGFDLAGMDFRVMGVQELMRELRQAQRELMQRYRLDRSTDALRLRFEELCSLEERTVRRDQGYESLAMNDFLERKHGENGGLAEAIERFSDYRFRNPQAQQAYDELAAELERLRELERFIERHDKSFRGNEAADYETAQQLRSRIEAIERALDALGSGRLEELDGTALDELGESAGRSLVVLRDLESSLRERGYLRTRDGRDELTPAAVRRIGAQALASVYRIVRKGKAGGHATREHGAAIPRPDETRPYRFGDSLDVDVVRSAMNALRRNSPGDKRTPLRLAVEDLEVRETDFSSQTTTVLLLDLSWSMSFENRFPAAKRVALAMDQLIRTKFPRDHFFVVGFSTRARALRAQELPSISWDPGDPFTNLQEGLMVAERLIARHPSPTPQILVITDGQPTAYFTEDKELHVEWPSGYGGISPRAVAHTLREVQRVTRRGITINTFMLHDSPELVGFVERMTEINRGRALFTDPAHLGSYLMVDHLARRRRG